MDVDQALPDIARVRLNNLQRLIERYPSKRAFCRAAGVGAPQLGQFFMDRSAKGFRTPGVAFCRRVEKALGLATNCLDQPNGLPGDTAPHKAAAAQMTEPALNGLTALQVAAVDELIRAFRERVIDDVGCAELVAKFVGLRVARSGG